MEENELTTRVTTGVNTRWSYCSVFEPKSINGSDPKYSVSLLIPKNDAKTVARVKDAIQAAYALGAAKLKGTSKSCPPFAAIKNPLRDGDVEKPDDEAYAGMWFVNANSSRKPGIIDRDRQAILDPDEVYSGCYGPASINFYAFNVSGNRGIACGLRGLMKYKDGERMGGGGWNPEAEFAGIDDDLLS